MATAHGDYDGLCLQLFFCCWFLLSSLDEWTTLRHNQTHFHKKLFLFQMICSFVGIGNHPIEALMKCESTTTTANCSKCFNCIPFLIWRWRTWLDFALVFFGLCIVAARSFTFYCRRVSLGAAVNCFYSISVQHQTNKRMGRKLLIAATEKNIAFRNEMFRAKIGNRNWMHNLSQL